MPEIFVELQTPSVTAHRKLVSCFELRNFKSELLTKHIKNKKSSILGGSEHIFSNVEKTDRIVPKSVMLMDMYCQAHKS